MSHRTWRILELLVGPLPPTILFAPPMFAGIVALTRVAREGNTEAGLPVVLGLLIAGMVGIVALWVAVLRGKRLEGDSGSVRAAVGAGLLVGLIAVGGAAPSFLSTCRSLVGCSTFVLGFGGPTIVGVRYIVRLMR